MRKLFLTVLPFVSVACLSLLVCGKEVKQPQEPLPPVEKTGEVVTILSTVSLANGGQTRGFGIISNAVAIQAIANRGEYQVDLQKEMVLYAAMGQRNTGGYSIAIDDVRELADRLVVYVKETVPGPRDMVTMALTSPICYAVIPKTEKPIYFNVNNQLQLTALLQWSGTDAQVETPTTMVARTVEEAKKIFASSSPAVMEIGPDGTVIRHERAMPEIDFTNQMVVAVFLGWKPAGYGVSISGVSTTELGVQISYTETTPDPNMNYADVMTSPYAIAVIPAQKGEVHFVNAQKAGRDGGLVQPLPIERLDR